MSERDSIRRYIEQDRTTRTKIRQYIDVFNSDILTILVKFSIIHVDDQHGGYIKDDAIKGDAIKDGSIKDDASLSYQEQSMVLGYGRKCFEGRFRRQGAPVERRERMELD